MWVVVEVTQSTHMISIWCVLLAVEQEFAVIKNKWDLPIEVLEFKSLVCTCDHGGFLSLEDISYPPKNLLPKSRMS